MSRRERETESVIGGGAPSGADGIHTFGGGGSSNGSKSETKGSGNGTGSRAGGGEGAVGQTAWFAPIEGEASPDVLDFGGCKDGICPVPWAKAVDMLMDSEFLTQDRNSNFPGENTIGDNPVFTIQGPPALREDVVNHPSHYTDGGIECIEAIEAQLTVEELRGYLKGNIAKYVWREKHKGGTESLKKARWYLDRLIGLDEI